MAKLISVLVAFSVLVSTPAWAEDWTGPYAGFSFGYSDANGPGALGGSGTNFGPHIGYDYDFGSLVLGGELEFNWNDLDLGTGGGSIDDITRLKLRGGYDFGPALGYVVVGAARAGASGDSDTAAVYGIGVAYPVNDRFVISGEALRQNFSDLNGQSGDADTNTFNLRTTFRF